MSSPPPESRAPAHTRTLQDAAELHRALGHSTRLQLVQVLSNGEATVGDLSQSLGLAQATTSRHLAHLHSLRLLRRRRMGHHVQYRLATDEVGALVIFTMAVAGQLHPNDGPEHRD